MLDKLVQIVDRLTTDLGFRQQVQQQPDTALASYQLNTEEKSALKSMLAKSDNFSIKPYDNWWGF